MAGAIFERESLHTGARFETPSTPATSAPTATYQQLTWRRSKARPAIENKRRATMGGLLVGERDRRLCSGALAINTPRQSSPSPLPSPAAVCIDRPLSLLYIAHMTFLLGTTKPNEKNTKKKKLNTKKKTGRNSATNPLVHIFGDTKQNRNNLVHIITLVGITLVHETTTNHPAGRVESCPGTTLLISYI